MFTKTQLTQYTTLYRSGNPFKTGAVIVDLESKGFQQNDTIPYFQIEEKDNKINFIYKMSKEDVVYGLGETLGALNKRGKIYRFYNTDDPEHTPDKMSLYGSHPFMILDGKNTFGLFIDYPSEIIFDIGFTDKDILQITVPSKDFDFYIFDTDEKLSIIKEYFNLTGKPYIPPKWAFGFQQSKWSYFSEEEVRNVAKKFRETGIPCDVIYTDIDYMDSYKVFTIDKEKFPNYEGMVKDLKEMGIKVIPIIDPGVKIEKDYPMYEEGKEKGFFCVDENGNDFVAAVWPGPTHFPNFLNSEVRRWWGKKYKLFTDMGIKGFWNDMNEPSIFFTPKGLDNLFELLKYLEENKENAGIEVFLARETLLNIAGNREDYKSFYHKLDDGSLINHDMVHNLYGFNMTKATADELKELCPNERYLLLSRSSYPGLHRMASIWMGDNKSWWEHMLVNIRMLQSLNMLGFFYTGADVGGFGADSSAELVIRWMELGAFTPFYRNHTALNTRPQEPWQFDEESLNIMRDIVRLRYAFIPYTYSEYMNSVKESVPFVKPLSFVFEGDRVKDIEDQYMYGESLMVAPVHEQNKKGRYVHLPEMKWLNWTASKYEERNMKVYEPGDYYIEADLNEIPLFIKENSMILLSEPMNYVGEKEITELTVIGLVSDHAIYNYYDDDGTTYNFSKGEFGNLKIDITKVGNDFKIDVKTYDPSNILKIKKIHFEIYDIDGSVIKKDMIIG
ncbi:alpha-glucosidase [Petrotoga sp. HKA.pet.4.5]|uniref:TIM-barrel domain-containing protein n=1 Tax=unclassified Petrotoga TaxID=2620614 RepID=UPI000EF14306|nr:MULTISPECIES: TIM-barrel domain-containing protein [unclassified Petrotoga]RLL82815.1 alpha-glucosidase [Petrotoga sp. Shatin.DS.tank11.9.2.9.3]RLL89388.1 alpha-glucosidase [Petrotoga sp. HKA.pet.4.5]